MMYVEERQQYCADIVVESSHKGAMEDQRSSVAVKKTPDATSRGRLKTLVSDDVISGCSR